MSEHAVGGPFDYYLYGLQVRSEWPLSELPTASISANPDVFIRRASEKDWDASAEGASIAVDGVAKFRVSFGREIQVFAHPDVPARNVTLYLLGSAMGLLLHQRGLLPLHANGIEIEGKAVAFMGASGSGKSTLAAWFHDRGYRIIADDVCVVSFEDDNCPLLSPGLPRLRLWREALEASGRQTSGYKRSYAGDDDWEKYDVPLPPDAVTRNKTPLAAIYLLERADQSSIDRLNGTGAARALFENTYRGGFVAEHGNVREHWEACLRLVQSTPVFCVSRQWALEKLEEECARILDHARHIVTAA